MVVTRGSPQNGGYRSGRYASAVQGKRALVLWGDRSPHRSTGVRLARGLELAGMDVSRAEMRGTSHRFPVTYQEYANQWLLR